MTKLVLFCHSLRSDWNHGNAHFLRGVLRECQRRGIAVAGYEPAEGWSASRTSAGSSSQTSSHVATSLAPCLISVFGPQEFLFVTLPGTA